MLRVDKVATCEVSHEDIQFSISGATIARLDNDQHDFGIIGQPRAIEALRMGFEMGAKGYNIFVTGMPGTGKRTAVQKMVERYRDNISHLRDFAYVSNLHDKCRPMVLYFAPGQAREFKAAMQKLLVWLRRQLPAMAATSLFRKRCDQLIMENGHTERQIIDEFEQRLTTNNLKLVSYQKEGSDLDLGIVPLYRGREIDFEQFRHLAGTSRLPGCRAPANRRELSVLFARTGRSHFESSLFACRD